MPTIAQEGAAFLSKLFVSATAHTDVEALTETTMETFVGASTQVKYPTELTGLGNTPNYVTSGQLGRKSARQVEVQPTPPTLTFQMNANPSDAGQVLLLGGGSAERGFVVEIVGADGGKRYIGFNGIATILENVGTDSVYTFDVTIAIADFVATANDATS